MFCFEILRIFGENHKKEKLENLAFSGFLRRNVGSREPMPRCSPTPYHGISSPRKGWGAKMAPLGYATA